MAGDRLTTTTTIAEALGRRPAAGLAVGVIRDGSLVRFHGHGVADVEAGTPVTADTVFRIASISKTFTAIAVMQLWERGLLDLDAPAGEYLRAYRLVPATATLPPVTVRHVLTHTAGIAALRGVSDLVRLTLGWGVRAGRPAPSLGEYYRRGLRVEVELGTAWRYGNHGFATLGEIVAEVAGRPFDRYLRERVFGPLGMERTDLVRSERVRPHLATGYALRSRGLKAVADREAATPGAASVYSTTGDMARYVAALLDGGANEHGSVLRPETLATMFAPHYQPDPRVPGMGLAFFRGEVDGRRTVGHDGIWPGFLSQVVMAPDDGVGVVAFANTGTLSGQGAPVPLGFALLRDALGLPDDGVRTDPPERPEQWRDVCGWYAPAPAGSPACR
jgi:CubicO group peptidase (beta-lactamase class C family)